MGSDVRIPRAYVTAFCLAGMALAGLSQSELGFCLPFIGGEFGLALGAMGILASSWSLGFLLSPIGGNLSDRYGGMLMAWASLAILALAMALISSSSSALIALPALFMGGMGVGFVESSMTPLMAELYGQRKGLALNALHAFIGIGAFIGPLFGGLIIGSGGSWRYVYRACLLAYVGLMALSSPILRSRGLRALGRSGIGGRGAWAMAKSPEFFLIMASSFFYFGAEFGLNAWLPSFLLSAKGIPAMEAGLALGAFWGAIGLGRFALGGLVDKVGYRESITILSALSAASILLGLMVHDPALALFAWAASGLWMAAIFPTILAWATDSFPEHSGSASGTILTFGFSGAAFAQWFIGFVGERTSLGHSMLYLSASALSIGLCSLAGLRMRSGRIRL
ncbi:MAG: MFS transporter [Candidatus Bathyarchaeia archaeon]